MKAWRKEATKINARRKAGSKEPRARQQIARTLVGKAGPSTLMIDLFAHAGFKWAWSLYPWFGELGAEPYKAVSHNDSHSWMATAWRKVKGWFK